MSKINFAHVNQFQRNGHAPLPNSEKVSSSEWFQNQFNIDPAEVEVGTGVNPETGVWHFVYKSRSTGKSLTVAELQRLSFDKILQKYPKPPQGPSRFFPKNSIPRGISEQYPFGDPSIVYRGHYLLDGMIVRSMDCVWIENWLKSFVVT